MTTFAHRSLQVLGVLFGRYTKNITYAEAFDREAETFHIKEGKYWRAVADLVSAQGLLREGALALLG